MRILILLPNDSMGGAEQYLKMMASYHKDDKIDVFFLNKKQRNSWEDLSTLVTLHYSKYSQKYFAVLNLILKLAKLRNKSYDYIFTSHVYTNGLIGILLKLKFLKTRRFVARESTSIFIRYNGLKLLSYKLFYWMGYRKVNLLICQTELMKNQLINGFPKISKLTEIKVLPNPIDINLIEKQSVISQNYILPINYLVSAGRMIPEKGYDILINVFSNLKPDYPDLKLLILGDGSERINIEKLIIKLNLTEEVILKGFVENVYPYFNKAAVCVVSSRVEGFPNVLLQMMSQNSKVVSTKCAGGIEKIPGLILAETNNEQRLELAIITALESTNNNNNNRIIFDKYLQDRDISTYMAQVNNHLDENCIKKVYNFNKVQNDL
jgi:glycosyltransferase involved in cell wall biosynthesis